MNWSLPAEKIEEALYCADFSHGRHRAVWEKILPRLENGEELCAEELENVAGGLQSHVQNGGTDEIDKLLK
ncbi:MAG: hypothetical protein FWH02_00935 [Oscillospiraceae bacterium]|nr:hypothetical protein [Oscillospiraceae bacterium]